MPQIREIMAKIIRLAVTAAVVATLCNIAAAPEASAITTPSLVLDPTGGPATTRVAVTGRNFGYAPTPADTAITAVTFDGKNLGHETTNNEANLTAGEYILQGVASGSRVYGNTTSFTMVFKVTASSLAGTRALKVTTNATVPDNNGTAYFSVTDRKLTLTPTSGLVSTRVTVTGENFGYAPTPADTAITAVTFDSKTLTHETTNNEANLAPGEYILQGVAPGSLVYGDTTRFTIAFKIPANTRAGTRSLVVTSNAPTSANSKTASFSVTARKLTLTPTSGYVGIYVPVALSGFSANTEGILSAGGLILRSGIRLDEGGNATTSFAVPPGFGPGEKSNTVTFTDGFGTLAATTFTVPEASLSLDPTEGTPGTMVNLTGQGFTGYSTMTVQFARTGSTPFTMVTTPAVIMSDGAGNITGSIMVPGGNAGTATISVSDGLTTKSTYFTMKEAEETVQTALQGIDGAVIIVWGYDAVTQTWKKYDPAALAVSDLAKLERGKGYWIYVTEPVTLTDGVEIYELATGWNLIGWVGG